MIQPNFSARKVSRMYPAEPSISIDDIFEHRGFVLTGRRMARPLIALTPPALRYRDLDDSKLISVAESPSRLESRARESWV
jgi:hypothetical protein